ncbi:hypothetical protein KIH74_16260 [Kineosporia sp. J2-2]|uniref:Uncharacterized protein n=1 Tax=Kineosporia corallincola TaxID=2835133 RepID=A0ABS5TLL5_9ACTN|nr:hypothetical protein [Kineosporia corallincola]MBT0770499.1 hypothetical protein [Kineosporia corallincola]
MIDDEAGFVANLSRAFARQGLSPNGRGAVVGDVRLVSRGAEDFAVEVRYEDLASGAQAVDRLEATRAYMAGCGAESPADLAAFWIQELDERLLAAD